LRKTTKNINSLSDILKYLKRDTKDYKGHIWFRGQNDVAWKLQPSFLRGKKDISEFTLITRFKQNASLLINRTPSTYFDWLFQMQHHGVPTRLLDWTESALTALYFAVDNDKFKNKDGALWILLPTELNKYSKIDNSDENNFIPSFDMDILKNHDPVTFNQDRVSKLLPLAAIATRNNARMQAQLGVFTISHRDITPIEDIESKQHVWKYVIPKAKKKNIKRELELLGITKFQLFPELSSIGEIIKNGF
jgi:hypothetical protein